MLRRLLVFNRSSDDQDFVILRVNFCDESDKMIEQQIYAEKDKPEDEFVMNEIWKISDTVLLMLKTKAYYPTKHSELETTYGMSGGKDWGICQRDGYSSYSCELWW